MKYRSKPDNQSYFKPDKTSLADDAERMISIIEKVASGDYSIDITEFTGSDRPDATRRIAEAFGMMMVRIEAREYHLHKDRVMPPSFFPGTAHQ
ncbi:MAG TPA: hypothetical protein ENN05_10860 [Deltaproteobacteria bacterium]|nr:hypothetical protein [Deltaproteobacteria bacterium]